MCIRDRMVDIANVPPEKLIPVPPDPEHEEPLPYWKQAEEQKKQKVKERRVLDAQEKRAKGVAVTSSAPAAL